MNNKAITNCPVCGGGVETTEVSCAACDVQVRGHFPQSRFDRLTGEQAQFLETFLRCRGVIRDVEAALGISYPTVRARLDGVLGALGLTGQAETPAAPVPDNVEDKAARRRAILAAISAGQMDAQSGLDALQNL